jgi:hypothetical protein
MEATKLRKKWVGLTLGGLFALVTAALIPSSAGAVTLGNALDFSALSTGGDVEINNVAKVSANALGDAGGSNVTLGSNSLAGGDAIAFPGDIVILGNFSKVKGACITGSGGAVDLGIGAKCGSTDTTGGNGKLTVKADAITDVGTFETALTSFTPTIPLGPVTLAAGKKGSIVVPNGGVLNVIEVPSVKLGNSSTLTLIGDNSGQSLVLRIDGNLDIGSGARILLSGISVNEVLIYVGGSVASWGNTTAVGATLLAPNSACAAGSGAKIVATMEDGRTTLLDS